MAGLGLNLDVVSEQASDEVPANHVLRTTPSEGRTVRKGRHIQAVVSTGKELISTPNVVDRTVDRAREMLQQADLEVGVEQDIHDELTPKGYVISQSPPAGSRLEKGEKVNLVVSKGPATRKAGTEEEEKQESVKEEIHAGRVKIHVPDQPRLQQVKIVVRDSQGEHVVHDQLHAAGEVISEEVSGIGNTLVEVYLNNRLVQSKTL
jgi:hypothetical protein